MASTFPVIDMKEASLPGEARNSLIKAGEEYGFFQIVNHGVPQELMENMMEIAKEFFEMPMADRAEFYEFDSDKPVSADLHYADKENTIILRDTIRHDCNPLEDFINFWPEKPERYREVAGRYAVETNLLASKLCGLLCEALGLRGTYIEDKYGKLIQMMRINYYPPCTDPSVTTGMDTHTDPVILTFLLLGQQGLQLFKDGEWITVEPVPNALGVFLGSHLQAVSNGRFISPPHRASIISPVTRISIPMFFTPSPEAFISPAESLLKEDNPARYKGYVIKDFHQVYYANHLGKAIFDHFKV